MPPLLLRAQDTGAVTGNENVGGLVGRNYYGTVVTSYSTGTVSGTSSVGGSVGRNNGAVTHCYSTAEVSGESSVGGPCWGRQNQLNGESEGACIRSNCPNAQTAIAGPCWAEGD
jgi:hypothetical protein